MEAAPLGVAGAGGLVGAEEEAATVLQSRYRLDQHAGGAAATRAVHRCKRDFFGTLKESVTADDLRSAIPVLLPKCNPLPDMIEGITGVGKLDLALYTNEMFPVMDAVNWWLFVKAVATKNLRLLKHW